MGKANELLEELFSNILHTARSIGIPTTIKLLQEGRYKISPDKLKEIISTHLSVPAADWHSTKNFNGNRKTAWIIYTYILRTIYNYSALSIAAMEGISIKTVYRNLDVIRTLDPNHPVDIEMKSKLTKIITIINNLNHGTKKQGQTI
jgi:hypothetical protein